MLSSPSLCHGETRSNSEEEMFQSYFFEEIKVVFYKHSHIFIFLQPNKTAQLVSETEASAVVQSHIFIYNLKIFDTS